MKQTLAALQRILLGAAAAMVLALFPLAARASVYGSDSYGANNFNGTGSSSSSGQVNTSLASPTQQSTVVQTPSGIEVAINLADGQAIPSTGYYITITPLNSNGKTFDKAEIYLDGVLVFSGAPDSTGTLKWFWDVSKYPASKVKIIVYGPGAGTTTHEFNVTVTPVASAATNMQNQEQTTAPANEVPWMWIFAGIGALVLVIAIVIVLIRRRRGGSQLPPPAGPGFIQ